MRVAGVWHPPSPQASMVPRWRERGSFHFSSVRYVTSAGWRLSAICMVDWPVASIRGLDVLGIPKFVIRTMFGEVALVSVLMSGRHAV